MGLIISSRLLSLVPALTESIKVAGLVLITDIGEDEDGDDAGKGRGRGAETVSRARGQVPISSFYGVPEGVDGMLEEGAVLRFGEGVGM